MGKDERVEWISDIYIICMWNNDRNVTPEENVRIVNTMQERSGNSKAIYKYNQKI